ncbi:hypothetical protein HMPREF3187_00917, partial [Aerococcus christensenii]
TILRHKNTALQRLGFWSNFWGAVQMKEPVLREALFLSLD